MTNKSSITKKPILKTSAPEHIKYRLRKQQKKTQTKKDMRGPKDVIAGKDQGLDDNDNVVSATKKKAKKRKADGDAAKKAPKKQKKKKKDEKTAVENVHLSKRRLSSDGRPESVHNHTILQELHSVEDENTDRTARAESDHESTLETNEKVTRLRHLDIHKEAKINQGLEVLESNEVFSVKGDELEFSHTKVIMRRGPLFLYSTTRTRYKKGTQIDLTKLEIHPIPRPHIYPVLPTLAPNPLPPHVFLKRPNLISYAHSECLTEISALSMHEAQMCQMIKRSPHPNVAKYFGCLIDEDGRISELCFSRHRKTLNQMVEDGEIFDRTACLDNITAGIKHLHSLGMIHCDINPHNVFADVEDFVIGDFDSCALEGDKLGAKAGTHGWTSDDFVLAQRENDWFGFAKIKEFLLSPNDIKECL
ncbi:uncharacterized protein BP5553_07363 [Venustampulla echinocandica]|uniref:Protein kinase domain-containing protein n=1 Tax=Venustampulla echinocandica TaxID=2656787 RepID=A0A370TJB6_9HELO|nr:uncharacterized protein BP5553_07363 [Venustampulla echinocandica]RDL35432.1 hypothetical protein BP5553_07363 [Venustampulla echinocandica]